MVKVTLITMASIIVTYLLFWGLSDILEKNISEPARKIADNMNLVSSGNLDVQMEVFHGKNQQSHRKEKERAHVA
ncbi:hypothetical protein [Butyrivibrio sp. JL13D10]|uniref:hypothetical protein n=1 Tax=Butyrivibrio sp. JL13D10 TaxID=3236815 RepID=UPI0038B573EE